MAKPRILFIAPLPPPVHGSAMVSQYIKDSKLVNEQFDCDFVNLSTSRRMDEIGKGGIKKLLRFIGSYFAVFFKLLTRRYDLCYLAITCHGMGFLKDAPFVLLCKLFRRKVMIHQHNKGMSACVDRWPYRWLLPLVYRNTRVMLLSWYLYPDISRVVKREQVVVCANGVPPLQAVGHWPLAVGPSEDDNDAAELQANSQAPSANSQEPFSHADCTDYTENASIAENTGQQADARGASVATTEALALQRSASYSPNTITQNTHCFVRVGHPDGDTNPYTLNVERLTMNEYENEDEDFAAEQQVVGASQEPIANSQQPTVRLLFLSNLIPSKGVYVLLDACKELKERGLTFSCDFVGGETKEIDRATFVAAVKERGLEGVVCYQGPKYGEEKEQYWQRADVFVFPTFYYNECFPLVLLEAMQWRLPLVSSDEGGIPDMVEDGVNGFVCPRQDAHALAEALERLITGPALRQQMGERGYQRYCEEYTLEAFEKRFAAELRVEE